MLQQTETKEMKRALVAEFGHPFLVRRDRGTASHWIQIHWTDGPPETLVRAFTARYQDSANDDIMTDLWCGGQYTLESRYYSFTAYRWAVRQVEIEFSVELPITVSESWRKNGEMTGHIKEGHDQIVDPDNPDHSQGYASNKVNHLLSKTDFRGMDLTGFEWIPGEAKEDEEVRAAEPWRKIAASIKIIRSTPVKQDAPAEKEMPGYCDVCVLENVVVGDRELGPTHSYFEDGDAAFSWIVDSIDNHGRSAENFTVVFGKSTPMTKVKQDDPPEKKVDARGDLNYKNFSSKMAHYEKLRNGGRYNGLPKAATFWREVLDATCGLGIRPYSNPAGKGWLELEEFQSAVPNLLRNYKHGVPPDEVAQSLKLEGGDNELYEKLRADLGVRLPVEVEPIPDEDSPEPPAPVSEIKSIHQDLRIFERPEIKESFSFSSSKDVYEKMKGYQKADREMFLVLSLNAANVVIDIETHSIGAVNTSPVYPRQVFRSALLSNASSLICVHNHPTGDPKPSASDKMITKELVAAGHILQIRVLDHVILGDMAYFSFADEGLMGDYESTVRQNFDN